MTVQIEPLRVVQMVEDYVRGQLDSAEQHTNRSPLDESGIWSLHDLAALVYAEGFESGVRASDERWRHTLRRTEEACRTTPSG